MDIVLIEDRVEDADLAIYSLNKNKEIFSVKWLEDGQSAYDYLFNEGEFANTKFDIPKLILLDLKLPKIDGLDLLEQIKKNKNLVKIPIVILTSSNQEKDIKSAYELGANSYIVKPLSLAKFIRAIQQIGLYWLLLNHPPN